MGDEEFTTAGAGAASGLEDDIDDDDVSVVEPSGSAGPSQWTQSSRGSKASQMSTARQATPAKRKGPKKNVDAMWGGE